MTRPKRLNAYEVTILFVHMKQAIRSESGEIIPSRLQDTSKARSTPSATHHTFISIV